MPPSPRVAQDHRAAEPDQQQRDQKVRGGPEPIREAQPEQHDRAHHHADARGVAQRPREAQATGIEQSALASRERDGGAATGRASGFAVTCRQAGDLIEAVNS